MLKLNPYDTSEVLVRVDDHAVLVLALCALALIGNYIFWIENLRLGWRMQRYAMPLPCIAFFLAHDLTFVASYDLWFNEIDHWFPKLWWFGLVATCLMEVLFLAMFLRFGRQEVAPMLSRWAFGAAVLIALVGAATAWLVIKSAMDDQLYLTIFGFTVFWCGPWYFALTWRRQDPGGQTVLGWCGYLMMPVFYWPATMLLSEDFRSVLWIGLGVAAVLGGLINIACMRWLNARAPADEGERRPGAVAPLPN